MKEIIYQHISDQASFRPKSGETVSQKCVIHTGTRTGRILFTWHSPGFHAKNATDVTLLECEDYGGDVAVLFENTDGGLIKNCYSSWRRPYA